MRLSAAIIVPALICGCAGRSASSPATIVVAGSYKAAFEVSSFKPCASNELWWVDFDSTTGLGRTVLPRLAMLDGKPDSILSSAITFARFRGDTTPRGRYGHLGSYERRFHVLEVLDLRPPGPTDCNLE